VATLAEDVIRAAGAIVWRRGNRGDAEIALVHRPKYDDWSLPKGKLARDEHVLAAAVREVREETGAQVTLGRPLPIQRYLVNGQPKEVHYWAATPVPGEHDQQGQPALFTPNREVDRLLWLPVEEATARLTHPRDGDLVTTLMSGPLRTTPIVLLRHGKAVERADWTADDRDRPLNQDGQAEAERLADLLDAYAVTRVLTSDARRCIDTVRPYAQRRGLPVEVEPAWSESAFAADEATGLARVRPLARGDQPAVLSGHRQVLPKLAAQLCESSAVPPPPGELVVGGFWVLHIAEGKSVALEQHEPAPPGTVSRLIESR
jgi:8-oxo-dGTP diphosphatase